MKSSLSGTVSAVGILASATIPTYWAGAEFNNAKALGGYWYNGITVYYPGQVFEWLIEWGQIYPFTLGGASVATVAGCAAFAAVSVH